MSEYTPEQVEQTLAETVATVEEFIAEAEAAENAQAELDAAVEQVEKELLEEEIAAPAAPVDEEEEESDYDDEDDFDPNETLLERISALKEILTPAQRNFVLNAIGATKSTTKSATQFLGSSLWYLATSGLIVGVPLAIAIFGETQLMELEKELGGMQQQAAASAPAPAPVEAK